MKINKVQLTEIQDDKILVLSDGKRLNFYKSNFNNKSNLIYLFIHDIYGLSNFFIDFVRKNENNIVTFLLPNFNKNLFGKSVTYNIYAITEMINFLKLNYPNKKIILVGEGFGSLLVNEFMKKNNVFHYILINLLLANKSIQLPYGKKFHLHFPLISYLKSKIILNVNFSMLTTNKQLIKQSEKRIFNLHLNYLYLYQTFRTIKKIKINDNKKVSIIQSKYSVFYNDNEIKKRINNINQVLFLESENHLLSSSNEIEKIFLIKFNN